MKTPCVLIFPCTYPYRINLSLISLVFPRAAVLLPSEDSTVPEIGDDCLQPFTLNAYVPSPLGDDLPEFNKTLSTWEAWATQIGLGEGISALSLLQAAKKGEESTVQTILESLRHDGQVDSSKETRLFLALAHKLDMHEDDLSSDLEGVEKAQDKIQALLKDPVLEQHKEDELNIFSMLVKEPINVSYRLKFWTRLYHEHRYEDEHDVLIGIGLKTQDIMERYYEVATDKGSAKEIMSIPLALVCEDISARREAILPHLADIVEGINNKDTLDHIVPLCQNLLNIWNKRSRQDIASNEYVGPKLVLEYFEGVSLHDLFNMDKERCKMSKDSSSFCFFLV